VGLLVGGLITGTVIGFLVSGVQGLFIGLAIGLILISTMGVVKTFLYYRQAERQAGRMIRTNDDVFVTLSDLGLDGANLDDGKSKEGIRVLGCFDNDGRLKSDIETIPDVERVSGTDFIDRYRFGLDLVLNDEVVLVKKDYRGNRAAYSSEVAALSRLENGDNCPAIAATLGAGPTLLKSFVPGPTVRQLLILAGATILSKDTENDFTLNDLSLEKRISAVWARGRAVFSEALPPGFIEKLKSQLDAIHRRGVTGFSLTFGNVVAHARTGEPWFIDFDKAVVHRSTSSMAFRRDRDRDRDLFNRIWGTQIMTETRAVETLERIGRSYAPMDLGGGLVSRGFWTPDSGTGRWEVLNGRVVGPLVRGKRVLDLGTNNGVMPMMMFREGARQVVGLELDPGYFEIARDVHALFEWRDIARYDFDLRQANMRAVLDEDFGKFGVVTAFCSLYYLGKDDMARVTRRVAEIAPVFVVQAKTDTRAEAAEGKALKSSTEFLFGILQDNGFPSVVVQSPKGFTRPLLVGSR